MVTLNSKNVGDTIKIKTPNGAYRDYIIVHKGNPDPAMYDSSCDGVWLLDSMPTYGSEWNNPANNNYEASKIHSWINGDFITSSYDPGIAAAIKQVKLPFKKGAGNSASGVQTKANGLSCKVFLLSMFEVGADQTNDDDGKPMYPVDGAKLSYFTNSNKRAAGKTYWWLRTPRLSNNVEAAYVGWPSPEIYDFNTDKTRFLRPAFILPYDVFVDSDNAVISNMLPTVASDKTGDLGELSDGFSCNYSVNDPDETDSVTVTLTLDGKKLDEFTAEKERQYSYLIEGNEWLKITNGSHTFKIAASDGRAVTESTAVFSRNAAEAFVTLSEPFDADDVITACSLRIEGSFPADAVCRYEVTNNALDDEPVWEDCTERSRAGLAYIFKNRSAQNGFAFNFRVSARRGASNAGGYITRISGGFE